MLGLWPSLVLGRLPVTEKVAGSSPVSPAWYYSPQSSDSWGAYST